MSAARRYTDSSIVDVSVQDLYHDSDPSLPGTIPIASHAPMAYPMAAIPLTAGASEARHRSYSDLRDDTPRSYTYGGYHEPGSASFYRNQASALAGPSGLGHASAASSTRHRSRPAYDAARRHVAPMPRSSTGSAPVSASGSARRGSGGLLHPVSTAGGGGGGGGGSGGSGMRSGSSSNGLVGAGHAAHAPYHPLPLPHHGTSAPAHDFRERAEPAGYMQASMYAATASVVIETLNHLGDEATGLEGIDHLPMVIVCGAQSAGKSSLLEAVCGIPLPRNHSTTTRCPFEIRLMRRPYDAELTRGDRGDRALDETSSEADNVVEASLTRPEPPSDARSPSRSTTKSKALAPAAAAPASIADAAAAAANSVTCSIKLRRRAATTRFGPDCLPLSEMAVWLRRAQTAILNPAESASRYEDPTLSPVQLEALLSGPRDQAWSNDVICLEVYGAAADLTLVDLPGLVQSLEPNQKHDYIRIVDEMVQGYMNNPRALILATVSCKDDIQNQKVYQMAQRADPTGARTIGILTKPDTIERSAEQPWLDVMGGDTFPLAKGWYMVRNPSQLDLSAGAMTPERARRDEATFFANTLPWCLHPPFQERLGVLRLRAALEHDLFEICQSALPEIKRNLMSRLMALEALLAELPGDVVTNPKDYLSVLFRRFEQAIDREVAALDDRKDFWHACQAIYRDFYHGVASTQIHFVPLAHGRPAPSARSGPASASHLASHPAAVPDRAVPPVGPATASMAIPVPRGPHVLTADAAAGSAASTAGTPSARLPHDVANTPGGIPSRPPSDAALFEDQPPNAVPTSAAPATAARAAGSSAASTSTPAAPSPDPVSSASPAAAEASSSGDGGDGRGGGFFAKVFGTGRDASGGARPPSSHRDSSDLAHGELTTPMSSPPRPTARPASPLATARPPKPLSPPPPAIPSHITPRSIITIAELVQMGASQRGRELFVFSNTRLLPVLLGRFQESWGALAQTCLRRIADRFTRVWREQCHVFASFPQLEQFVHAACEQRHARLRERAQSQLGMLVEMERRRKWTMHESHFAALLQDEVAQLGSTVFGQPRAAASEHEPMHGHDSSRMWHDVTSGVVQRAAQTALPGSAPAAAVLHAYLFGDPARPPTAAGAEGGYARYTDAHGRSQELLQLMGSVRAYFTIASARFQDSVPMAVDFHLLEAFCPNLEYDLLLEILNRDDVSPEAFLVRDSAIQAQRDAALHEKEILERLMGTLETIE